MVEWIGITYFAILILLNVVALALLHFVRREGKM
jgi:hypothetical protein